jgi:glycosyltransferase involved in cell wall biosynthesis
MVAGTTAVPRHHSGFRILHLWSGNLYGGVERFLASLAQIGHADHHFALCFDGRLAGELRQRNGNLHLIPAARLSSPRSIATSRAAVGALIQRLQPTAVVTHSHWPAAIWGHVVRARAKRWVFYAHDLRSGHGILGWLGFRLKPHLVIANSTFTARGYESRVKTMVIHYPVVCTTARDDREGIRERHGAGREDVVLLQVGRMQPWKGHSLLLRSLSSLTSDPTWQLWFVGGPQRPEEHLYEMKLRSQARQFGIGARVRFLGERTDVLGLMRAADIFCQANSRPEPFGLVFVEALSQALPVVALAEGGIPEIITPQCGILASKERLSSVLQALIQDRNLRRHLGANGPARAAELCDPARQTELIESAILGEA